MLRTNTLKKQDLYVKYKQHLHIREHCGISAKVPAISFHEIKMMDENKIYI